MLDVAAYLFLVSLLSMGIATPVAIRLGRRWNVLDSPGPRKIHSAPIPLTGGWVIFFTLTLILWGHLLGALAFQKAGWAVYLPERLQEFVTVAPLLISKVAPLYAGAAAIFFLGLVDDIRTVSVKFRIVVQTGIALVLAILGLHPSLGFLPNWMAALVGVMWIVGITNSFNFLDGLDGLSAGVGLVATMALLTIMGISSQPDMVFFLAALLGTQLGFLRFNYHPAKIFLGSSGSLLLGYLLATSTLLVTYMQGSGESRLMPLLTPLFILAIPLYDTTSVVLIRLIQKRSIAIGDQNHFHHRLLKLGFSHRQTVAFIILIAFSVGLSAVRLVQATLFQGFLIVLQILGILSLIVISERVAARVRTEFHERRVKTEALALSEAEESKN
jgi:UDP-GlcNAc:undecaprenyl-phosphate GlcNAc-1-phosphate transferase